MRILLILITFCFLTPQSRGQSGVMNHLFKDQSIELTPVINPTFQLSEIVRQPAYIPGIRAAVLINKKMMLGVAYHRLINELNLPEIDDSCRLGMQWGGIHFEYTVWPLQRVHLTFPVTAGVGQLKVIGSTNDPNTGRSNFIFIEPGWMLEVIIWKYIKFGIGTSYRITPGWSYQTLRSGDIGGFSAVASVKIGLFNNSKPGL